jgi:multidrug resistance efflux pump
MADVPNIAADLLQFESNLRACLGAREVAFTAVNESFSVMKFDQAVIWKYDLINRPLITAASGLADVSLDSPYVQWLGRAIRAFPESNEKIRRVQLSELPENIVFEGSEWCSEHMLVCLLKGPDGLDRGGMLFSRAEPFADADLAVAEWMARSTGYSLWAWRGERRHIWRWLGRRSTLTILAGAAVVASALGFIPVQLNALASAEITPQNPIPITSPVDGVIKEIVVKPNQIVKAGEVLAMLDETSLRNRLTVAQKALEIAQADSQRAINKAFSDEQSRTELQVLVARVREKRAEVAYTSDLLNRLTINAPQGGVAVFASSDEWTGKPVQPGERIMVLADPSLIKVTIYVSPEDAVDLEPGAEVKVFLNINPLDPLMAKITRSSYEAQPQADGTLAYVVQAELMEGHGFPRIGLRGTAKIYAEEVTLAYYLFRKPVSFIRQRMGF